MPTTWMTEAELKEVRKGYKEGTLRSFKRTTQVDKKGKSYENHAAKKERQVRLFLHEWEALDRLRQLRGQKRLVKSKARDATWTAEARRFSDKQLAREAGGAGAQADDGEEDGDEVDKDDDEDGEWEYDDEA